MSLPMNRPSAALASKVPDGFNWFESKQLTRLQNAELTRGLATVTRMQAAATVASIGTQCVGMLSREARFQEGGDPAAAARLQHVADQFACFVGNEVARFGLQG